MTSLSPLSPGLLPDDLFSQLEGFAAARGLELEEAFHLAVTEGLARLEAMHPAERQQAAASMAGPQ